MQPPWRVISLLCSVACSANDSARLIVVPDTLALHGSEYSSADISIVDDGETTYARRAILTPRDKSIVRISGQSVACLRDGIAPIEVATGEMTTSFVVKCRIAARLEGTPYIELEPGGAPRSLAARAVYASGDSAVLRPIHIGMTDTTVVVVRDGHLVPLTIGRAGLRIDYGGVWVRMAVLVRRIIASDTLTLAASEARTWQLEPGRYSVTVKVKSSRDLNILNMETTALRCSRDSRDGDTIHCVADEQAEVILRNRSSGRAARPGQAFVRIIQMPTDRAP